MLTHTTNFQSARFSWKTVSREQKSNSGPHWPKPTLLTTGLPVLPPIVPAVIIEKLALLKNFKITILVVFPAIKKSHRTRPRVSWILTQLWLSLNGFPFLLIEPFYRSRSIKELLSLNLLFVLWSTNFCAWTLLPCFGLVWKKNYFLLTIPVYFAKVRWVFCPLQVG